MISSTMVTMLFVFAHQPLQEAGHTDESLVLSLVPAHHTIRAEDPLFLKVIAKNAGSQPITFRMPMTSYLHTLGIEFRKVGTGEFMPAMPGSGKDVIANRHSLKPAHSYASHEVLLADPSTGWAIEPGKFEVRAVTVSLKGRYYYSEPVVIHVQPIDDQEQESIGKVRRYFGHINSRFTSDEPPKQPLVDLERALSPCILKDTLRWTREWGEVMRNEQLTSTERQAALEKLADRLDDVTAEAFVHITADHYQNTKQWISALRELAKLPEHTEQSDSIRDEVLNQLENQLERTKREG
ncbi:MAG: hypothetical protein ABI619_01850 [Betaproteobacteria bacterium]